MEEREIEKKQLGELENEAANELPSRERIPNRKGRKEPLSRNPL